jgi:hypothetical protein
LFTAQFLQLDEEKTGLTEANTQRIHEKILGLFNLKPGNGVETLEKEASLTLIYAFDVFYGS